MKVIVVLVTFLWVAVAGEIFRGTSNFDEHWKAYKSKHGKKYKLSTEDQIKRKNWEVRHALVTKHNEEAIAGKHTFVMSTNEFSDLSTEEFSQMLGGQIPVNRSQHISSNAVIAARLGLDRQIQPIPDSVDLRNSSCMPPVKTQGICSSCWAFAAITPLEYGLCMSNKKLVTLSEQQLIDCSRSYGNYGCQGGWYMYAWRYIWFTKGEASSAAYPYTGRDGTCRYAPAMSAGTLTYYASMGQNATFLKQIVASRGAVAASIQILSSFRSYTSGIYSDPACPTDGKVANHIVVIVGYGTLNNTNYWIIRNSWGTSWGMKGYMFIKRGVNMCNIESFPGFPII